MKINEKQEVVIVSSLLLLALLFFAPPWLDTGSHIWLPICQSGWRLDVTSLAMEVLAILSASTAAMVICRTKSVLTANSHPGAR
jgi:hypothetical protein